MVREIGTCNNPDTLSYRDELQLKPEKFRVPTKVGLGTFRSLEKFQVLIEFGMSNSVGTRIF